MDIAQKFIDGITSEQLTEFINSVFSTVDEKMRKAIFDKIDKNIEALYRQIASDKKNNTPPVIGVASTDEKFKENFEDIQSELNSSIMELGNEEGKYVLQEHHWETPEFYASEFADDIDKVFTKMLPLLNKVYDLKLIENNYFTDLLDEIKDGINEYPEWMGAEYSEFVLEKKGLECILKWNWLKKNSIKDFITDTQKDLSNKFCTLRFSQSFLSGESEEDLKKLYAELCTFKQSSSDWQKKFEDANSIWHDILHTTEKAANKEAFLKTSVDMISQKWEYGIPVYENHLELQQYKEAEQYCEKTIIEFFRQGTTYNRPNYTIEKTLFATHIKEKDERINKLFTDWEILCNKLNLPLKLKAIKIQHQFYLTPANWPKLKNVFLENKETPYFEAYVNEWKNHVVKNLLQIYTSSLITENWLGWLIDFILSENSNEFISMTTEWLNTPFTKKTKNEKYSENYFLLLLLTRDIFIDTTELASYPVFTKLIISSSMDSLSFFELQENMFKQYRLSALKQANAALLKDTITESWKKNIHCFIPHPENVCKADYFEHAKWLAIARELNGKTYEQYYNNWKIAHRQRINLWRELGKYSIYK
ncbi:MAG TPA: hypothetical protein DD381_12420 [Lentisphaeria bacterium]|nr:MAG: hypothetical protein A2X47_02390 [Lentisphaerae bacterium GWF2_38_69]HBM17130.1 hypothetical protein [Lentisphaeria bacterium]